MLGVGDPSTSQGSSVENPSTTDTSEVSLGPLMVGGAKRGDKKGSETNHNKAECGSYCSGMVEQSKSEIQTLDCESELAHLGPCVVARQTLIRPLIPQPH